MMGNTPAPNRYNKEDLVDIDAVSGPVVHYHKPYKYLSMMKVVDAPRLKTYTTGKLRIGATFVGRQGLGKGQSVIAYPEVEDFVQKCDWVARNEDASKSPVCNKPNRGPESERFLEKP
jgi:hypothetical protein